MLRSLRFLIVVASVVAAICEVAFASSIPFSGSTAATARATITDTTPTDTTPTSTTPPAAPPKPPVTKPLVSIIKAYFHSVWAASTLQGPFVVVGTAAQRLTLAVTLRGGGRKLQWRATVGPGKFRQKLDVPSNLLPGRYPVSFAVPSAPKFAIKPRVVMLYPPPEGVVSRVFTSASPTSFPRTIFARGTSIIYAQFFFAPFGLPKSGHTMTTQWFNGREGRAEARTPPKVKIRAPAVFAFIGTLGGQPLEPGAYKCELRAGGVFVKSVTAYIR